MKLGIISDNRFIDDYQVNNEIHFTDWNSSPRYLLGRILLSPHFSHEVKLIQYKSNRASLEYYNFLKSCDYGIIHVDSTIRPNSLDNLIQQLSSEYLLINRNISDIRKSTLHKLLKTCGLNTIDINSDADGDIIAFIKSDFNAGDTSKRLYKKCKYKDIPISIINDPSLIIQRYIKEIITPENYYRLRRFIIVGQEIVQVEFFSKNFVIKRSTSFWQYSRNIKNLNSDLTFFETPNISELGYHFIDFNKISSQFITMLNFIKNIGFEFGAIDVITPTFDELYILDINSTPWERGIPSSLIKILSHSFEKMVKDKQ